MRPGSLLKSLLQERHWQPYRTFCIEYDKIARTIDASLVGRWPSRTQFNRWLAGSVKELPYPDHCRVLEGMFPGVAAVELFKSPNEVTPALGDIGRLVESGETPQDVDSLSTWATSDPSGTEKFYQDFVDIEQDWESLFNGSATVDIAMMYGSTWRNTHYKRLRALAERPDGRIRVVLPHYDADSPLVPLYASTLHIGPDEFRAKVRDAVADFRSIEPRHHVEIYLTNTAFRHAVYMFADRAILALYALCGERISTPALLVSPGGLLNFLQLDFDHLVQQSDRDS